MKDIYEALDDVILRTQRGEDLEAVLQDYPEHAENLRRLVAVARTVNRDGHSTRPSEVFKESTRPRIIREITTRPIKLDTLTRFQLWLAGIRRSWRRKKRK